MGARSCVVLHLALASRSRVEFPFTFFYGVRDYRSRRSLRAVKMKKLTTILCVLSLLLAAKNGDAQTVTFEDLTTRDTFAGLGIENTYSGFQWGYGYFPGFGDAKFGVLDGTGWASATVSNPALSPAPAGVGGNSYAWNSFGPQNLWIDFEVPVDFVSGDFSTLSPGYSHNGSTVQLFGYSSTGVLLASSPVSNLGDSMQTLTANLNGIKYLEISSAGPLNSSEYFSVDNLVVKPSSTVPDSGSVFLLVGCAFAALVVGKHISRGPLQESI
jgi:hypothetical protein